MRDAADEWEPGSAINGWGGGGRPNIAMPSVLYGHERERELGRELIRHATRRLARGRRRLGGTEDIRAASEVGVPGGGGAMGLSTMNVEHRIWRDVWCVTGPLVACFPVLVPQHGPGGAATASRESGVAWVVVVRLGLRRRRVRGSG